MTLFIPQLDSFAVPILGSLLLLLFLLQYFCPLRTWVSHKLRHALKNVGVAAPALLVFRLLVIPAGIVVTSWTEARQFGLMRWVSVSGSMNLILSFLLLDVTFYYWHILNHRIPLLWRFHNVHHIDRDLDVTTAFRFHFIEMTFSIGFRVLQLCLLGVSTGLFFLYEIFFEAATEFHHSNLQLPIRLERLLNLVIVTPRMHGIHHSIVERETNSNFSVLFSWWDRLHGSACLNISQDSITIGVPAYLDEADRKTAELLLLPFRQQKPYWRLPDGSSPQRDDRIADSCGKNYLAP